MFKKCNLRGITMILFLVLFEVQPLISSQTFTWKDHLLAIDVASPPALVYVMDSQGEISGADPAKGLDQYGQGSIQQQIPGAWVEQDHLSSDAVNGVYVPDQTTSWSIAIPDKSSGTYLIHLTGITTGTADLQISALFSGPSTRPKLFNNLKVLCSAGISKEISVTFDPIARSLQLSPKISPGTLAEDTSTACRMNLVGPSPACAVLQELAMIAQTAAVKGHQETEAKLLMTYEKLLNRLHNWGQAGQRGDWDDFSEEPACKPLWGQHWDKPQFFAKDPAYSALKLDVDTLLGGLAQADPGREWNGQDHGH